MRTGIFAFLWLLSTLSFSVFETRRQSGIIDAAASRPSSSSVVPSSSARRWNSSAVRRRPSRTDTIQTKYVTKIQVEDLDDASSVECVRLRELNFCDDEDGGTARHPGVVRHSSEWEETAKVSPKLSSLLLDSPSCRRRLRPFLCVALTPSCSLVGDATPASLPPCRTLCSVAAEGCRDVLEARGIEWPAQWTCDQYPVEGLCLDRPPPHQGTGLKIGLDRLDLLFGSETFVTEYRGSLQPPPSSVFDGELASPHEASVGPSDRAVRLRRRRLADESRFFGGWVDVQGLGHTNDYCRVVGTNSKDRILSCALNGTESNGQQTYVSKQGFDAGRPRSGFMKDVDGDRRDDYCRCVGNDQQSQLICMKAGERGFYGSKMQSGSQYTIRINTDYCRRYGNAFN